MGIVSKPIPSRAPVAATARGFTLIEIMVVLVIAGIILGVVSVNAMPSSRQLLQNEAQRVALLLQLARDEAIVRNQPIAIEIDAYRYRFLLRSDNVWKPIEGDDMLREREFKRAPLIMTLEPPISEQGEKGMRIVFGREPVDKPFVLRLGYEGASVAIQADGIGHFTVE
ncbi:MAG: type II secretion system minor pseudopilin GspH [Proteobacteria bacterium]|nr:type II secretion system minor pseudopilin GspH [Pseudomonadota bacterium]